MRSVERAECTKSGVSVESTECEMRSVEIAKCRKCGV